MAPSFRAGRLGLSLAGGGFRASLFHVGVLHRLLLNPEARAAWRTGR
jgi:predicted patatin/cPLA2 family phospholipase